MFKHLPTISTALLIFLIALLVRAVGLGQFLTADEPRWIEWSSWFLSGLLSPEFECPAVRNGRPFLGVGWQCTLNDSIPGVTTMWLGSLGMLYTYYSAYYSQPQTASLMSFLTLFDEVPLDLLPTLQLPFTVIATLFIMVYYLLLRKLFDERIALVATLLLALQPFHIALSRVIHHDALTTAFVTLSVLTMLGYWLYGWHWRWLVGSAIMAGFAILSKPIGWFTLPYAALIGWLGLYYRWRLGQLRLGADIFRLIMEGGLWGIAALLSCVLFFPAMWQMPLETIQIIFNNTADNSLDGHLQLFWGQVSPDPGTLFYLVGWLLRSTPLEIMGLLCFGGMMMSREQRQQWFNQPVNIGLLLFIGLFLLFVTLSPKKQLRFLLPFFPVTIIFTAVGLLWFWNYLINLAATMVSVIIKRDGSSYMALPLSLIILGQGWFVWSHYPYYFTYYNPLFGGTAQAQRIMTIGWGEGQNEVAAYLNQQPQSEPSRVSVIGAAATFRPFFEGDDIGGSSSQKALSADLISYYISTYQRIDARPEYQPVWEYLQQHYLPEQRVTLHGVDYVLLYRNPIEQRAFWEDDHLSIFGYNLTHPTTMTLFWQPRQNQPNVHLSIGLASPLPHEILWTNCTVKPNFMVRNDGIVESDCLLSAPSGIYQLWLGSRPYANEFVQLTSKDQVERIQQQMALDLVVLDLLPATATPFNLLLNEQLRLIGYEIIADQLALYWQITDSPDWNLVEQLWVTLDDEIHSVNLSSPDSAVVLGMMLTTYYPSTSQEVCIAIGQSASQAQPFDCWQLELSP